jgi:hypothetical protein
VRRIISDYLLAGTRDERSIESSQVVSVTLTSGARVMADGTLGYPAPGDAEVTASGA